MLSQAYYLLYNTIYIFIVHSIDHKIYYTFKLSRTETINITDQGCDQGFVFQPYIKGRRWKGVWAFRHGSIRMFEYIVASPSNV